MADEEHQQQHTSHHGHGHHFLVVAYGIQSHINPARALAHRLAQLSGDDVHGSILATLSVHVAAHRRMFPSSSLDSDAEEEASDGVISYVPHSDGFDDGSLPRTPEDWALRRRVSAESLSAMLARFAAAGGRRPAVTCIVCTLLVPAAVDVATRHGVPFAVYWIQPATVLAAEYHYFHGYGELVAAHVTDPAYEVSLPGLRRRRPLRIRDLPSYLVDTTGSPLAKSVVEMFKELFESMDRWRPMVLVNTFDELEPTVISEMKRHLDVFAVGPMVGAAGGGGASNEERTHLYKHDAGDKKRYMEWLGAQPERSVVYVSFGSIARYTKQQMEEMVQGLLQCGRPYLLAVRRDGLEEGARHVLESSGGGGRGMVVDWCNQPEVLTHAAVGCFVSHCGWNSTIEALAAGVPLVGVPSMFDQPTNAYLVEEEWEIGIRGERNSEGVLAGMELARCVELVMDQGTKAMAMRERVTALKERAQLAANAGGPAERNLQDFVSSVQQVCGCVSLLG
ncbi:cyanidin 3-O-rutinoside 5-O-glucosyltransferase [Sorghum bicolor]|jgi:UDP:flavonoid glycosyltransferase YjiC (YdhE family)|uniref:cyanidin 3-O-rutinoside 5-O-glucosyltransferase n=1 Tax=Sorghum bicolor TaxID=4558 RepID=UPI0001A8681F|nr:cyanidin 3-O-rutinoside 5-O-glucosyltransferase [Sorghum bicolor]|eukprot:XP_002450263.1 cyanidin 3-O-rutinoside 5-O-glucosyltransferase [Sorghum bicolor]